MPGPDGGVADVDPPPEGVATATHDPSDGSPDPGSVLFNLPFSTIEQKISYEITIADGGTGVDLTGRTLRCRLKVDSGLATPDGPAGLKLYVKSGGTSLYADGGWNNINVDGQWQTFTWGVGGVVGYVDPTGTHNPADVRQVGIEIATGSAGTFSEGVVHFDSFGY
jgi:hypothetical protein